MENMGNIGNAGDMGNIVNMGNMFGLFICLCLDVHLLRLWDLFKPLWSDAAHAGVFFSPKMDFWSIWESIFSRLSPQVPPFGSFLGHLLVI